MKQITIIYHSNCYDGLLAAYAAWLKLGDSAEYVPMGYDDLLDIAAFKDKDVYMVDFSVKYDVLVRLAVEAKSVTIIDHHKTAEAELTTHAMPSNVTVHFDMSKAGCVMAAEHFLGYVPWFFVYIGDRDIWAFKHEETKAFCAGFNAKYPLGDTMFEDIEDTLVAVATNQMRERDLLDEEKLCEHGNILLEYRETLMHGWLPNMRVVVFEYDMGKVPIGVLHNVPVEFTSELGHKALEQRPDIEAVAIVSTRHFETADHPVCSISWRSLDDRHDVSAIAKSFGGGGHRNAAGCTMSFSDAFDLNLFS